MSICLFIAVPTLPHSHPKLAEDEKHPKHATKPTERSKCRHNKRSPRATRQPREGALTLLELKMPKRPDRFFLPAESVPLTVSPRYAVSVLPVVLLESQFLVTLRSSKGKSSAGTKPDLYRSMTISASCEVTKVWPGQRQERGPVILDGWLARTLCHCLQPSASLLQPLATIEHTGAIYWVEHFCISPICFLFLARKIFENATNDL